MILHALDLVATDFLERLAVFEEAVAAIEARLEGSLGNREVLALLQHQKSLIHFTVALDEMYVMLEHLQKVPALRPTPDDEAWLEDVTVEFRQALGIAGLLCQRSAWAIPSREVRAPGGGGPGART